MICYFKTLFNSRLCKDTACHFLGQLRWEIFYDSHVRVYSQFDTIFDNLLYLVLAFSFFLLCSDFPRMYPFHISAEDKLRMLLVALNFVALTRCIKRDLFINRNCGHNFNP